MARRSQIDKRKRLAAAYLAGEGRKRTEIAAVLRLAKSTVTKLVTRAAQEGYLETRIRFRSQNLTKEELEGVKELAHPSEYVHRLQELAKDTPLVVRVFDSGRARANMPTRLTAFCRNAAEYLAGLVARSRVCGVSWGITLRTVVDAFQLLGDPSLRRPPSRPITFVPLAGEPLGKAPAAISASILAQRLDEIVNHDSAHSHSFSLAGLPALVPLGMEALDVAAVDRLFAYVDAYATIFLGSSGTPPLVEQLDAILTSCGPIERPLGLSGSDILKGAGVETQLLVGLAEVSGVLLERETPGHEQGRALAAVRARWRGVCESHMRRCAERAKEGRPGVIVVAWGASRCDGVVAAVQRGLVNHLVIDQDLASALDCRFRGRGREHGRRRS